MATIAQLEMLAGRALLDARFLEQLLEDPQGAANSLGISLTLDQVKNIQAYEDKRKQLYDVLADLQQIQEGMPEISPQHIGPLVW